MATAIKKMTLSWQHLVFAIFLGFMAVQFTDAITCYQCADTKLDSPCYTDYDGLTNTSKGLNITYKKNCSDSNPRWDRCVIETHIADGGKYTLFHRGCHDGKYFNKNVNDTEFLGLAPNNFTTCAYPKNKLVCFTFCDSGDYCNGPQPVYGECDKEFYDNKTIPDSVFCGGNRIHDNGLVKCISTIVMFLVIWGASHSHT